MRPSSVCHRHGCYPRGLTGGRMPCTLTIVVAALLVVPSSYRVIQASASAKALFYDPALGDPNSALAPPSPTTGLTPVGTRGTQFVGVHYWFVDGRGQRFAEIAAAPV